MKINKIEIYDSKVTFIDRIEKVIFNQNDYYTKEQFEILKESLINLPGNKIKELIEEVIKLKDIEIQSEKENIGEQWKHKLFGYGVSIVMHWTAIATYEIIKSLLIGSI